jgi:hypothetical protein
VYPAVIKGARRIEELTATDPLGLLPISTLDDDEELKDAHFTGQNMITLQALLYAISMAEAKGNRGDIAYLKGFYKQYRASFDKQLATQIAKTGGYIPPALDRTTNGNDWDNLQMLHPLPLFEPFDPRVSATITKSRGQYQEGIMTYLIPDAVAMATSGYVFNSSRVLHYWQSPNNSFNALVRGEAEDQRDAVNDLYALLLHTTSTHAPQEYGTYPWGTRDYSLPTNITPMMATSGRIVSLLRHMLVREYGQDLYLLSAVSPEWLKPGAKLRVNGLLTEFGPLSMSMDSGRQGWTIHFSHNFRRPPHRLIVRLPWFCRISSVEVDGHAISAANGQAVLPPSTKVLKIRGSLSSRGPFLSYKRVVDSYKREYRRRYKRFLTTGESSDPLASVFSCS